MPNVEILVTNIAHKLFDTYNDDILCHQYAWWLLEALTKQKKVQLIEHFDIELTEEQDETLNSWIKKLIEQHYPLQYLLGSVPFCDLDILVEQPVLIPRPETEEWTANLIKQLKPLRNKSIKILDLCTGSGCIALALGKALPQAQIVASDIQDHALHLAEKNCAHNNILNVAFFKSDLFTSLPQSFKFDLIVGNPPYIEPEEWQGLDHSVKDWEDKKALVAPDSGLQVIANIIKQAPNYLRVNEELETEGIPQLILEIGFRQGLRTKKLLEQNGYCNISIEKDLEGKDRIACARVVPCGLINNK
jgi:release factor glutamine methyltransferase